MIRIRLGYGLLGLAFLVDRLLKMINWLALEKGWLAQTVVNEKIISGLFFNRAISLIIVFIILFILIFCFSRYPAERAWLAWLIAGAASNGWDRLIYGGVIDYWSWNYWPWVFNLADLMIIGGLIWYLIKSHLARPAVIR